MKYLYSRLRNFAAIAFSTLLILENPALASDGSCPAEINDIKYLIFWPPLPGGNLPNVRGINNAISMLGTVGDGKTRQLGIGGSIPIWARDQAQIIREIKLRFDIAKRTNTAVHFLVDDHIGWDERPDLWNWYDPKKIGYNPDNRYNVEWYDWEGSPNKRRYFTPDGAPSKTPHMCYNSPAVQKEISRIVSEVVGPVLNNEIAKLKKENKDHLFAGITVGAEAGFDDYSVVSTLSQIPPTSNPEQMAMAQMLKRAAALMEEDKAPYRRVGYCALSNTGYSKSNPPKDFNQALTILNRAFIEFWDKQFVSAGIPCSRIYTHVAASPPQNYNNNAPIDIVFNRYARPGWTTYPLGTLVNGLQPLYIELAKRGNPAWAGVEANNAAFVNPNAPSWEKYLAWHYNYGAKLVGVNIGATDQSIMSSLNKGASSAEALAAFRNFLMGEKLKEE